MTFIPGAITPAEVDSAIAACTADNPCEAAWQTSYAYAADRAYELAVFQALQGIVFGAIQYASADRTADLQYDIANRQMVIAEAEYQRYLDEYVDCEESLNEEVCALEIPEVEYDSHANRALRDVRKEFTLRRRAAERLRSRYCCADLMRLQMELDKEEALAVVQARDVAYRWAEKRQDYFDERRWHRRITMVNVGRDVFSGQSSTYQSGMGAAIQALDAEQAALDNFLGTISGGIGSIANARYARNMQVWRNQGQISGQSMIYSAPPSPGGMTSLGLQSGVRAF